MDHSQLLDRFEKLGLNRNEASVYLALLKNHPVTGYKLSKDSGILRPIVYEMLNRLVEKGGVKIIKSTTYEKDDSSKKSPEYYSPITPDIFLSSLEKKFTDAKTNLSKELLNYTIPEINTINNDDFWNIYDKTAIIAYIQDLISSAKTNISFYINDEIYSTLLKDALSKKVASGIKVIGFSYRDIQLPGTDIYTYKIDSKIKDKHIKDDRILLVVDNHNSIIADMDTGKACQSTRPAQIDTVKEFINMKIILFRISYVISPTKLALYLFDEDKDFLDKYLS